MLKDEYFKIFCYKVFCFFCLFEIIEDLEKVRVISKQLVIDVDYI